ncbi:MAG: T9SS type A sorting domain-containing protein [Bacteroidales bacterium]|jgi:hypothetical protein|nr:T9SS type A sorting domain-containing protein [Bacteroidales bacterium]
MKTIKIFFSFIFLIIIHLSSYSQQISVEYFYDAIGNRTSRTVFLLKKQALPEGDSINIETIGEIIAEYTDPADDIENIFQETDETETEVKKESVEIISDELIINIYPNPVKEILHFEIEGINNSENINYEISDINGRITEKRLLQSSASEINFTNSPPGMYFLRVYINNEFYDYKIIKE